MSELAGLTLLPGSHSMTARLLRSLIAVGLTAGLVLSKARTSMVDGFPYKEEVGGSSPSVPTKPQPEAKFFAES